MKQPREWATEFVQRVSRVNLRLPRLKIRHQILILTLAPLILQIGISGFLYTELNKVNNNLSELVYRRRILAVLDDLQRVHIESAFTAFIYSITKKQALLNRYRWASDQVVKKEQELISLTRNSPQYAKDTQLLLRRFGECNHGINLLLGRDVLQLFNNSIDPLLRGQIYYGIHRWLNPMGESFSAIRSEPVTPESFAGNADRIRQLISLFFISCILLTAFIAIWGMQVIVVRLAKLHAHISQVREGKRTSAALSGDDELTELDLAIAESADKLLKLRQFKEDLTQTVSHDLRAPLTSIVGMLTLARNGAYGRLSDTVKYDLQCPLEKCAQLATLVNDVLDLERIKANKYSIHFDQYSLAELVEALQEKTQLASVKFSFNTNDLDAEFHGDLDAAVRIISSLCSVDGSLHMELSEQNKIKVFITPTLNPQASYHRNVRMSLAKSLSDECGIQISAESNQISLTFPHQTSSTEKVVSPSAMNTISQANANAEAEARAATSTTVRTIGHSRFVSAALALVIVPAMICCGMLWTLSKMVDESQSEIEKEFRSYQIIQLLNKLHASHMYAGISTFMYNMTKNEEFWKKQQEYSALSKNSLEKLKSIFNGSTDATEIELIARLESQLKLFIDLEKKFLTMSPTQIGAAFNSLPTFEDGLPKDLYTYRARLVREREKLLLEDRQAELHDREKAIAVLLAGIILVLGSTLFAHILLNKILTSRLLNALENAKKLDGLSPLNVPASGTDELATLDQYIYSSAQEIRSLELQRKQLITMLGEELKVPIQDARTDISKILEKQDRENSSSQMTDKIKSVVSELTRLSVLVEDLKNADVLDRSSIVLQRKKFAMQEAFDAVVNSQQAFADSKSIAIKCTSRNVEIFGDKERVIQILVNLVSNAIKFSPANSKIELDAKESGDVVKIDVRDSGPGISTADQTKIFQKFEQSFDSQDDGVMSLEKSEHTALIRGSGLGLHICKMLVEAHGGTISVKSEMEKGSIFTVTFPNS